MEIKTFEKEKMKLLTNEQQKSYQMQKLVIFVKKIEDKHAKDNKLL